ncbi:MAG: chorismate synthase [Crocinitomicaceae bacterium]
MAGNSIGHIFKLSTFGESHGGAIGGMIDGCPANIELDLAAIQNQLDRRRPGQSAISTQRKETDEVQFLSGITNGVTLGTPIGFIIPNKDQRSKDYDRLAEVYRPSHADYTYDKKYGIRDVRGGGRSSARETACRVVAGAIAQQILAKQGISIHGFVSQVGTIKLEKRYSEIDFNRIDQNRVRCPDSDTAAKMDEAILAVKKSGDTLGGVITCVIKGVPAGIGEPVFDKLHAELGKAMLSINAVKGFEIGSGFQAAEMKGSEHNDAFIEKEGKVSTATNFSGGIQGGISNGQEIQFRVAFKPVATIMQSQKTVNKDGEEVDFKGEGRHDPCVVPRAVPIVDAMAALVLLDQFLRAKVSQL